MTYTNEYTQERKMILSAYFQILQEIARLYLLSTALILLIMESVSVVMGAFVMGWNDKVCQIVCICIGYLIVLLFDLRRIKRIPMDVALKNVE